MEKLSARKLLGASTQMLKQGLAGRFTVLFEDGVEVETNDTEVIYSSYVWDLIRAYPLTPITSKLFLPAILGGKPAGDGTHTKFFNKVIWAIHDHYDMLKLPLDMEHLAYLEMEGANNIYNDGTLELGSKALTTDYLDYIELSDYPPMAKILATLEKDDVTDVDIDAANRAAQALIMNDPGISHNQLIKAARSGLVRMNQMLQCTVVRGFVTNLQDRIFAEPSLGNFGRGYRDWYSAFTDSCTIGIALNSSLKLLPDTEYGSRKLQIMDMVVETVYDVDCGSQEYISWRIAPDRVVDGRVVRKSDFGNWCGKYFLDEETNQVRELTHHDTHLIGKTLQFRSSLAGCRHPDKHGICRVCFSSQAKIIPKHTNIGHAAAAYLMQILVQLSLSQKHVINSASASKVRIAEGYAPYIKASSDGYGYVLQRAPKGHQTHLVVHASNIGDIAILGKTKNVTNLVPDQISEIGTLKLKYINAEDDGEMIDIPVELEKRKASFTHQALNYIKANGFTRDNSGNYIFDFSNFPAGQPFLALPKRVFNTSDHAAAILSLIQGAEKDRKRRSSENSLMTFFQELYEMVNEKLEVSAHILEIIIYGGSVRDSEEGDFRLPRAGTPAEMGILSKTVPGRSAGPAMAFERHAGFVFSTALFMPKNLSSHLFDVFVMPQETVLDRQRRGLR